MGNVNAGVMVDVLYDGQEFTHITGPLVQTENVHGTGCTLSTAIACELAKGLTVLQVRTQHPHSSSDSYSDSVLTIILTLIMILFLPTPLHCLCHFLYP